jgi:hypothetical protein
MDRLELCHVGIDFAFSWLVHFWRCFLARYVYILLNSRPRDTSHIQNKLHKLDERWLGLEDDILVADHMHWDLGLQPEVVEVLPHGDFLLNELGPVVGELVKISIRY